jgi:glyoxylase-like metal-dependent hydrolase (beta-lactamase superfamily II)
MSALVRVLTRGYAVRKADGRIRASSSAVLVVEAGVRILADPGADGEALLAALSGEGLGPGDMDIVFLTHAHPDHFLAMRLFSGSAVCDGAFLYQGDEEIPLDGKIPGTSVEVVRTPGHTPDHASLLVHTHEGPWAVSGDLFWWWDDEERETALSSLLEHKDEFSRDFGLLKESRLEILKRAGFIVPGHGKVFRSP